MPDSKDPPPWHSSSAHVVAGRIPWRRLKAVLLAAAIGLGAWIWHEARQQPTASADAPSSATRPQVAAAGNRLPGPDADAPVRPHEPRFASFGTEHPTADVRHIADWAIDSGDPGGRSFVVVDKRKARVWLFDQQGELVASTPALLGAAVGDDPVPGIGEKPLSEVLPEEKTTPAGRYVAEPGVNANGEDIVWVSYDLAVSMHRVRPLVAAERRLQRLASPTPKDNRISFGCINLPVAFYEQILAPTVRRTGAVVYVLPETRSPEQQFGSYDVFSHWLLALAAVRSDHVK